METYPLLLSAVEVDNIKLVESMLDYNIDVNEVNHVGDTALFIATFDRNMEMIKFLLNRDADINIRNNEGQTVLHFTLNEMTQIFIDHKSNIHNIDFEGCTPLHSVCEHADLQTIKCLLKNGANLNSLNLKGRTPLLHMFAYLPNHLNPGKIIPFLLDHSDVNVVDKDGNDILKIYEKNNVDTWFFVIIEHIAKLKVCGVVVNQSMLDYLTVKFKKYFSMCVRELLSAKNTKFTNSWVSFFHLLVEDEIKLVRFAGNRNIVRDFKKCDVDQKFPIYGAKIHKNFSKTIDKRKIWDNSTITLRDCLPIFDTYHLIIRNILECLSTKDLSKLS